ncbi:ARO10 [[Candida] subhashii]|uniref:ARO10 n=1 Tax=[Candida] subhashii TaxID=561895 RepID=A0A8J5QF49_9ASCO|nr:ARO10 [[Candida] subhashii]KAG7660443.1 ARO10 [[Candida] subhashii]
MTPVIEIIDDINTPSNTPSPTPIAIPNELHLGEYLFLRITQANPKLRSIFGIPGDFNVDLLEHLYSPVVSEKEVKFVGLCNELNGAYCVDGYARAIGGMSVLITTFGVGELSAINGIAGAFAEHIPVLHIVGTTTLKQQSQSKDDHEVLNYHHLVPSKDHLHSPNHDVYKRMAKDISVAQESLDEDMDSNITKIDHVLNAIIQDSRPGYLFIPCDIVNELIPAHKLYMNPFDSSPKYKHTEKSMEVLEDLTDEILNKLYTSKSPSILSDCLSSRFGYQKELDKLIKKFPAHVFKLFTTHMARNVDESLPNYVGVYNGKASTNQNVLEELENNTDVLLTLGYYNTEVNTGAYSRDFSKINHYIEIHPDYVKMNHQFFHIKQKDGGRLFTIGDLIEELASRLDISRFSRIPKVPMYNYFPSTFHSPSVEDARYVPQTKLIDHFNNYLRPNDLLIVETMSFAFGMPDIKFPPNLQYLSAHFYGSIGYAVPATFGATMALNDIGSDRRIILVQGDGAAQMTVQELSSFIRYKDILNNMPEIYLINNDGYTVERAIRGPTRSYNDINGNWKWVDLFKVFGDTERHEARVLKDVAEFEDFFSGIKRGDDRSKLRFYEVIAGKYDVPDKLNSMLCKKKA